MGLGLGGVCFLILMAWAIAHGRDLSPQATIRRISTPGVRHRVRLNSLDSGGTWDPSGSWKTEDTWNAWNLMPRVYGPGTAEYWLDEQRQVHLQWSPDKGEQRELVGPVPSFLESSGSSRQGAHRHLVAAGLSFYAVMTLAGLELGYRFAQGSHDRRLLIALFCGLAGYGVAYVVVMAALVVIHARRRRG